MKLVLITPLETSTIDNVNIVTLPGSKGRFTVLHQHAPLVSAIRKGVIRYDENTIAIDGGVVEVKDDLIKVITEQFDDV